MQSPLPRKKWFFIFSPIFLVSAVIASLQRGQQANKPVLGQDN